MTYLINSTNTYVVPTVQDALKLREELDRGPGELNTFTYTTKYVKEKGEVVGEYQLVKAKLIFNEEKAPESGIRESYGYDEEE